MMEQEHGRTGLTLVMHWWQSSLRWRHNEHDGVSNHQHLDGFLNHFSRCISKKTSKLHVTGLCKGNSLVTGEFPSQKASNAKNGSLHDVIIYLPISYGFQWAFWHVSAEKFHYRVSFAGIWIFVSHQLWSRWIMWHIPTRTMGLTCLTWQVFEGMLTWALYILRDGITNVHAYTTYIALFLTIHNTIRSFWVSHGGW